jgi:hypothetical protein
MIGPPKEHLGRQIAAPFAAQRALHNDGMEGKLGHAVRDIPAAFLASHNKGLPR